MNWHGLLRPEGAQLLALIPTTLDRVAVWGILALVVALIAWREYTQPDFASPSRGAVDRPDARPAVLPAAAPAADASPPPAAVHPVP